MTQLGIDFTRGHGPDVSGKDSRRLGKQLKAVRWYMETHEWVTLAALGETVGASDASVSARLRDLRALGLSVERRRIQGSNAFEYRVQVAP